MTPTPEIRDKHNRKIKEDIKKHLRTIEHLLDTWMLLEERVQSSESSRQGE